MKKKDETKVCRACGKELPRSEFQKNKSAKDGLKSKCKNCRAEEARVSRNDGKAKGKSPASLSVLSRKNLKDTGKLLTRAEEQAQLKAKLEQ